MSVLKCKMCGGELEVTHKDNVVICPYCGTHQMIFSSDDNKKKSLYEKASKLFLEKKFQKAASVYEIIVSEFPKEGRAYWGLVLCKFGVENIDDSTNENKVMICHNLIYTSIFEDDDYKKAIEFSDVVSKKAYEEEAYKIDDLQEKTLQKTINERYDIFICYKETDINGNRTEDSVIAEKIYKKFIETGYSVFYSRITLKGKIGNEFEPIIYSALISSSILIHVTTSLENTNSLWVKNEWERFLNDFTLKKVIITCYKNVNPLDLPSKINKFQGIDLEEKGAMKTLFHSVLKIMKSEHFINDSSNLENEKALEETYQKYSTRLHEIDSFCMTASDFLPLIDFFTQNSYYKNCSFLVLEAKTQFIKHVYTFNDCVKAEQYLNELPINEETASLSTWLSKRKKEIRKKELYKKGILIEIEAYNTDISSLILLGQSIIYAKENVNDFDLIGDEKRLYMENQRISLDFFFKSISNAVETTNIVDKLKELKDMIVSLQKECNDFSFAVNLVDLIDNKICRINAIFKKEQKENAERKRIRKISIITLVSFFLLVILSCFFYDKYQHSARVILFKVIEKKEEFKVNASPYQNGGYFIYLDCFIKSKSNVGIEEINFHTTVYTNKTKIGVIDTSIDSMSLSAKSSKEYTITLKDNQLVGSNNPFFTSLYNAKYENLSFTFEVLYILFTDGRCYFNSNYNMI